MVAVLGLRFMVVMTKEMTATPDALGFQTYAPTKRLPWEKCCCTLAILTAAVTFFFERPGGMPRRSVWNDWKPGLEKTGFRSKTNLPKARRVGYHSRLLPFTFLYKRTAS